MIIEKKFFKPSGSLSNSANNLFMCIIVIIVQKDKALLHDLFIVVLPCFIY